MDNVIYYNIDESTYFVEIDNFRFYFSRVLYKDKFENNYLDNILRENQKISYRYNNECDFTIMLLFYLYKRIEKNGFYICELKNNKWVRINECKFKCNLIEV